MAIAASGIGYTGQIPTYTAGPTGDVAGLTRDINAINREGQTAANLARIPGAQGLEQQSSDMIGQELSGQLPSDVLGQIRQQAAERGIMTGSPDSPNATAAYLRALGLNSLEMQQQGQQNLTSAYARNPSAPLFDPTSQLLTPYQAGNLNLETSNLELARQRQALEAQKQSFYERMALMGLDYGTPNKDVSVTSIPARPTLFGGYSTADSNAFTPYTLS